MGGRPVAPLNVRMAIDGDVRDITQQACRSVAPLAHLEQARRVIDEPGGDRLAVDMDVIETELAFRKATVAFLDSIQFPASAARDDEAGVIIIHFQMLERVVVTGDEERDVVFFKERPPLLDELLVVLALGAGLPRGLGLMPTRMSRRHKREVWDLIVRCA